MSKTAQRKRSAYQTGYRLGLLGWGGLGGQKIIWCSAATQGALTAGIKAGVEARKRRAQAKRAPVLTQYMRATAVALLVFIAVITACSVIDQWR